VWPLAAETAQQGGDGLLAAVIGLAGLVVTGVVTVVVTIINRGGKTLPAPDPEPDPTPETDLTLRERMSILEYRADATDRAGEIRDRRLDQLERTLDLTNPRWRRPYDLP
jgi:hypothetical protein